LINTQNNLIADFDFSKSFYYYRHVFPELVFNYDYSMHQPPIGSLKLKNNLDFFVLSKDIPYNSSFMIFLYDFFKTYFLEDSVQNFLLFIIVYDFYL